ncbi:glycoside hydrolase family 3 C-terminal domain-containing protein [Gordonia sp. (in: high G+C Gram-positive bacteria)]|uniref:glycoside hydrolase family 3 C-terminal domain-containing protein n=1 Tax=Gordonia sp. (in: high G+C Gram-positive bacteria) TaxID=84139 RepID=UPI003C71C984
MPKTVQELLDALTVEEKASLTSGADFWTTKAIERLGISSVMLTDGPHGLRKQAGAADHLGINDSVPATCFPPAVALGSTFDAELAERMGQAIGTEAAIEDVAVVLGPGINIKRSPLCGRNFEYVSEDPIVAGHIGAALVRGIESVGVGTSLKHFAANNQETDRMRVSADIDPRPLHEIYLRAFEHIVTETQPWTVMCSYNRINGVYASQDPWLLTDTLRTAWGFEGLVVSDWGAVSDRVAALAAGLDLEMPYSGGAADAAVVAAVADGSLSSEALDLAVTRIVQLVAKAAQRPAVAGPLDVDAHHALAREVAGRSIVLLKNDGLLPLAPDASVAVIGEFARSPRFQGGGSSHINPTRVDSVLDALVAVCGDRARFAPGFAFDGSAGETLRSEAVELAAQQDVVVLCVGLPDADESEGFDRTHINLPVGQLELIDAVRKANPNVVVVLSNGSVVALPFRDHVPAIVETWLLGQAGGSATVDVLTGAVNPSGRLTETIPLRLEDTASYGNFPGAVGHVRYGEGIHVGYRWYDSRGFDVAYPFGHGLSYTEFSYGQASVNTDANGDLIVTVPLTNTGDRDGREVVQVYTGLDNSVVERAPRELKAFASMAVAAGQSREATITVRRKDLAYWDVRADAFVVEGGEYRLEVGASSRDIRSTTTIAVTGDELHLPLTMESSFGEVLAHPVAGPVVQASLEALAGAGGGVLTDEAMSALLGSFPIGRLINFPGVDIEAGQIEALIKMANSTA